MKMPDAPVLLFLVSDDAQPAWPELLARIWTQIRRSVFWGGGTEKESG